MRTNIVLNDDLVKEGFELTEAKTKRELVDLALRELVQRRRRMDILTLAGKVEWEGDLKEMRRDRFEGQSW
jgi:Arc/MetJ family transcription regulator